MSLIKIFLKSKWDLSQIKKKNFLLVDGIYNPFTKYYDKKDFNILYRRGEKLNIRILIKCIFDFNISSLNYFKHFIKASSPRLIFTAFDYHPIFYKIKKITNIKTLMIQKGKRTFSDNVFENRIFKDGSKSENYYVDYIFLYNKSTCENYKKLVKGNYFSIGSFENNFQKLNFDSQKKEVLFISNFKLDNNDLLKENCENDDLVAMDLCRLAKENKLKFNILPKQRDKEKNSKEFYFYKNILKDNFKFLKIKKDVSSAYKIFSKYKYIFCTYSTLGTENLSKGGRTGFIFFKSPKNPCRYYRFGSLERIKNKGPFWTSGYKFNSSELKRVFNFVIKSKQNVWKKKSKVGRKVLEFDHNNKIFRNIVNQELKREIYR